MYQNYNYYPTSPQTQNNFGKQMASTSPQMFGLKGRQVASIEEARATSIDFDGSIFYFPDLANKRIYTKQIMPDGTAQLNLYELKMIPIEQPTYTGDFITRDEFNTALSELKAVFNPAGPQEPQKEVLKTF